MDATNEMQAMWSMIVSFLIAGLVLLAIGTIVTRKWVIEKETDILAHMEAIAKMHAVAGSLIAQDTGVHRCLVLVLSNGDGNLAIGKYATALVSVRSEKYRKSERVYDRVEVDVDYITRMLACKTSGVQYCLVQDMPRALLRSIYETEGVQFAELHFLHHTRRYFFFCSFATYTGVHLAGARADISIAVSEFKRIIRTAFPK